MKRRTILHVGGAESVHAVYVNGRFVGYGTDSRLPSEYELDPFVVAGSQRIGDRGDALQRPELRRRPGPVVDGGPAPIGVARIATAGPHRRSARDDRPTTRPPGPARSKRRRSIDVDRAPEPGWTVQATLLDPSGRQVGRVLSGEVPHRGPAPVRLRGVRGHRVGGSCAGPSRGAPRLPDRYSVTVELVDPRGRVRQTETQHVGIRSVEVRDRQLLVNGRPIWIFGVNRHDHHPDRGKAVSDRRHAGRPAVTMRAHNVTSVRTSHYPNDSAFYDLCDELGFYVIDEANIESHAYNTSLCDDSDLSGNLARAGRSHGPPRSQPPVRHLVEPRQREWRRRQSRCARRLDSSGRSVAADPPRRRDPPSRLGRDRFGVSDIVCPMYPSIEAIREYGDIGSRVASADPERVQPCDGQQQRLAGRLLGRHHVDARSAGWIHLGMEGPGSSSTSARTAG